MADVLPVQASSLNVELGKGKMEVGGVMMMPMAAGSRLRMKKVADSVDLGLAVSGNSQHYSANVCSLSPFCAPDVRQHLCAVSGDLGSMEGVAAESETTGEDIARELPGFVGIGDGERWFRD
ncbi:hypothetical protein Dimus_036852 [Dionaea muscipula]